MLIKKYKIVLILLSFNFIFCNFSSYALDLSNEEPSVSAESAIVIDANSKVILFAKNEKEERPIASTTKIMTALLAIEAANKEDKLIEITDKMVPVEGSSMNLKVGDILHLSSLAKGMLTVSGNDAAHSAAIALAGDLSSFAKIMNERAKKLNMKNSNFITPSGLDAVNDNGAHRSTAYDMALLGAAAISNVSFRDISSKEKSKVFFTNPQKEQTFRNENKLLKTCEGCIGIKTGYTKSAGRCLVSAAERNGTILVAVTLKATREDWNDHKKLFDYGFSRLETITLKEMEKISLPVVGGKFDKVDLISPKNMKASIKKGESSLVKIFVELPRFIYAPVKKGQIIGKVIYKINNAIISEQNILSSCEIKEKNSGKFLGFF